MYTSVEIKNFRCFKDFKIKHLGRINLIGGKNNVGKTALLEALFLLAGGPNPQLNFTVHAGRGFELPFQIAPVDVLWQFLFRDFDTKKSLEFGAGTEGEPFRLEIHMVYSNGSTPVLIPHAEASAGTATNAELQREVIEYSYTHGDVGKPYVVHAYGTRDGIVFNPLEPERRIEVTRAVINFSGGIQLDEQAAEFFTTAEKRKQTPEILAVLKIIEPRLKEVKNLSEGGKPVFYGDIGGDSLMPFALMGDGLRRAFRMLLNIVYAAPDGIVLFDEIENGLHHSIMPKVWKALGEFSRKQNVQIFATTHSEECIQAAQQAFANADKDEFRYHRLDRINVGTKDETIEAVTYEKEVLDHAVERHIEVR